MQNSSRTPLPPEKKSKESEKAQQRRHLWGAVFCSSFLEVQRKKIMQKRNTLCHLSGFGGIVLLVLCWASRGSVLFLFWFGSSLLIFCLFACPNRKSNMRTLRVTGSEEEMLGACSRHGLALTHLNHSSICTKLYPRSLERDRKAACAGFQLSGRCGPFLLGIQGSGRRSGSSHTLESKRLGPSRAQSSREPRRVARSTRSRPFL